MDDTEIRKYIERAIEGDEDSFAALISFVQNKAYAIAYRYMKNDADARDAMQEAFIKMYLNLGSFGYRSKFETWFYRILINCCLDALRKRRFDGDIDESFDIADESPGAPEQLILKERQEALRRAIDSLSEDHRSIIILRELEGLSYEEIAQSLEIQPGTVKSRLSRAKENLKKILLEQNSEMSV